MRWAVLYELKLFKLHVRISYRLWRRKQPFIWHFWSYSDKVNDLSIWKVLSKIEWLNQFYSHRLTIHHHQENYSLSHFFFKLWRYSPSRFWLLGSVTFDQKYCKSSSRRLFNASKPLPRKLIFVSERATGDTFLNCSKKFSHFRIASALSLAISSTSPICKNISICV